MERNDTPRTLAEAIRYFSDEDVCLEYVKARRWPDGKAKCPTCGSEAVRFLKNQRRWKCASDHPRRQFSIKVGTIFEDSPLKLSVWLPAIWMIANCKNGVSSYEIHRALGVTQKTAWFMLQRIRLAMHNGSFDKMTGRVEADETYVGGKARFMHKSHKAKKIKGRGTAGKTAVMGLLSRHAKDGHSQVVARVVPATDSATLQAIIRDKVEVGATVYTDEHGAYVGLEEQAYCHKVINHSETYVRGSVHTNGIENFWACLKRGIRGTYVSVEPFHLFRYVDEQAFRFNNRKDENGDSGRFEKVVKTLAGKRITYKQLIGEARDTPTTALALA